MPKREADHKNQATIGTKANKTHPKQPLPPTFQYQRPPEPQELEIYANPAK